MSGHWTWWRVRADATRSKLRSSNGSAATSPSTKLSASMPSAALLAWSSISGTRSRPTTDRTRGASASASVPVPVPASRASSSPRGSAKRRSRSRMSAIRAAPQAASLSAVAANRARVSSSWLTLVRGGRARVPRRVSGWYPRPVPPRFARAGARSRARLGTPSSSPRTSGAPGSAARAATTASASSGRPTKAERLERPGLGRPPEAVDGARRGIRRRLGRQQDPREPSCLVRDRKPLDRTAERRDEQQVGRRDRDRPARDLPPTRRGARAGPARRAARTPPARGARARRECARRLGSSRARASRRTSCSAAASSRKPSSSSSRTARRSRSGSSVKTPRRDDPKRSRLEVGMPAERIDR